MFTFLIHILIIYLLPWLFIGAAVIGLLIGLWNGYLENYARKHTGWRPDKDDKG